MALLQAIIYKRGKCEFSALTQQKLIVSFTSCRTTGQPLPTHPWLIPVMSYSCTCNLFCFRRWNILHSWKCPSLNSVWMSLIPETQTVTVLPEALYVWCLHVCMCCKLAHVIGKKDNMQWQQMMVSLLALLLGLHDVKRQVILTVTASWLKLNLSLVHPVNKRQRSDTMQFIWLTNIDGIHWAPEGMLLSPQLAGPVKTQNLLPDWP